MITLLHVLLYSALCYAVTLWLYGAWRRYQQRKSARLRTMLQWDAAIERAARNGTLHTDAPQPEIDMAKMYRQGDVLLVKVKQVPQYAKDVTPGDRIVLAYGEVTGHAHAVYPEVIEKQKPELKAKLWDAGAERFLQVIEKTALRHEEHTPIELGKGVYRVVRQREFDPERDRWVAD